MNEMTNNLLKQGEVNNRQALKLLDMKNTLLEFESKMRIYPATEIKKKLKILVNVTNLP